MNVSRTKLLGLGLVIFAATIWLHWPSVHGQILAYGDDAESLRQSVRWNGMTWNAVKWAFTCTDSYYQPLVRLSHVLDYQLWGKNAMGHHATGVVLHALNAALVFGFLWTLLGATALTTGERLTVALWVAVVFAIHPLQVESTACISSRTQVLCTTFVIGSVWAYTAGVRRWVVWMLYLAALLCKPMAVSLPFAMLAIDYFPLRRHEQLGWGRLLGEKVPLIALAAAASLATLIAKRQGGLLLPLATIPFSDRVFLAFESLTFYPSKLVWPSHLSPRYPVSFGLSLDQWPVLASVLTVVMITAVVIIERRRMPMLLAAWGAYVMLVLPVSGLMPVGLEVVGQRHAYVAMLPLLLLAGAAGIWIWRRSTTAARLALVGLMAGQLCAFGARTRGVIPDWRNDETLRRVALAEFPNSGQANRDLAIVLLDQGRASEALQYAQRDVEIEPQQGLAHTYLGLVLGQLGNLQEAVAQDEEALRLNPDSAEAHYNFGMAMMELGRTPEAAEHYEQALRIKPDLAAAHVNLGAILERTGRIEEAIAHYEQALRIEPDSAEAHYNLGTALFMQGRVQDAITQYTEALRIKTDYSEAYCNRGVILNQIGKLPEAVADYEVALRIKPNYARAHFHLGVALEKLNKPTDAMRHYAEALRINPDYAEAHYSLGVALEKGGRADEAVEQYEQALRTNPGYIEAHVNLANVCLRVGDVPVAIGEYEAALRINPDYAEAHGNLGAILQRMGKLPEAVAQYEQALRIKPDYVEAHFNLGLALQKLGRTTEASEQYEQALRLRPDFIQASNALAQLQAAQIGQ